MDCAWGGKCPASCQLGLIDLTPTKIKVQDFIKKKVHGKLLNKCGKKRFRVLFI